MCLLPGRGSLAIYAAGVILLLCFTHVMVFHNKFVSKEGNCWTVQKYSSPITILYRETTLVARPYLPYWQPPCERRKDNPTKRLHAFRFFF